MTMFSVHLLIIWMIMCKLQSVYGTPTVQIKGNQIEGMEVNFQGNTVNQYLGVPYAQPPLGQLRFEKPQPVEKYPARAVTNPPACPQYSDIPYPWVVTHQSEDCLYLNIFTPGDASPGKKKAVLFWIHGGGFRFGSIREEVYSGIPLAALGDIVVVTVNYRLGALGFFTFLTAGEYAIPNIGLYDMLEGLKWVNQNIEAFGGDVDRITIAGESAGSISVGDMTVSPLAEGLYTRLIMQSITPITRLSELINVMNDGIAQVLADKVGCSGGIPIALQPKNVVECLKGVDVESLMKATIGTPVSSFLPQFGDEFLPTDPGLAALEGSFRCKDLFIGHNKDEASPGLTIFFPQLYGLYGDKNNHINITLVQALLKGTVGDLSPDLKLGEKIDSLIQDILPTHFLENAHDVVRQQLYDILSDLIVICPDEYFGEKCAEQGHNVYSYLFTHRPSNTMWAEWQGVAHYEEVQFVFGRPISHPELYEPTEEILSRQMIQLWTNFVKNGKPDDSWPRFSRKDRKFRYLGPEIYTGSEGIGPHPLVCDALRPAFLAPAFLAL